jgi:hypothetical protein
MLSANQHTLLDHVRQALDESDLPELRKRRLLFILRWRPTARNLVLNELTAALYGSAAIVATGNEAEPFQVALDWSEIAKLIQEYLPLLLQLLLLFI